MVVGWRGSSISSTTRENSFLRGYPEKAQSRIHTDLPTADFHRSLLRGNPDALAAQSARISGRTNRRESALRLFLSDSLSFAIPGIAR